jgi:hypothetical protein
VGLTITDPGNYDQQIKNFAKQKKIEESALGAFDRDILTELGIVELVAGEHHVCASTSIEVFCCDERISPGVQLRVENPSPGPDVVRRTAETTIQAIFFLFGKVRQRMKIAFWFILAVYVGWCSPWQGSGIKAFDDTVPQKDVKSPATAVVADEIAETDRLSKLIEDAVDDYQLFPSQTSSTELLTRPVLRWRNTARGQDGEAMLVVWLEDGHPLAMASIYPWAGNLAHEFDLLARKPGLVAKSNQDVIWMPTSAGVDFRKIPNAKVPGASHAARLREMKVLAARFEGTMTGWNAADSDNEKLRLLPRPLYRYQVSPEDVTTDVPLDGALFAFATGTDPEIVLMLEAVGTGNAMAWEYACVRATSGGLEMRLDDTVVWTAAKFPQQSREKPHYTQQVPVPESASVR